MVLLRTEWVLECTLFTLPTDLGMAPFEVAAVGMGLAEMLLLLLAEILGSGRPLLWMDGVGGGGGTRTVVLRGVTVPHTDPRPPPLAMIVPPFLITLFLEYL